jgi:hypothetical protein
MQPLKTYVLSIFTALICAFPHITYADTIPSPSGDIILTVTGAGITPNQGDALVFDRETLMALGMEKIETTTIWTEGTQSFEGVPLSALTAVLNVTDGTILATAINDYTVEIPFSDAVSGGPIIAMRHNEKEMSVREKGPLWIIYPYDQSARYRSDVIYSRSIWQLDRIQIVE